MKLVIDIDKDKYKSIVEMYDTFTAEMKEWGLAAIKNGTPLDEYCEVQPEPFINKPCVSEQVCHEDKIKVLDKIMVEIENDWQLKKYPSSPFSCGLRRALEIIGKYKVESEG